MKKKLDNFKLETKATKEQINNWKKLYSLFEKHPLSTEELVMNFGLFMKSSALAKILFLNELYEQIIDIPGTIVEFGVWWGQNICLFENLRAIYEPFNKNRRIIGFDTFSGYTGFSKIDVRSDVIKDGSYQVPKKYRAYLEDLLSFHEKNNILGNIKKHLLIEGNVLKTVPKFFKDNPEAKVAYEDSTIRKLYAENMLTIIEPIHYGSWAGGNNLHPKDVVIAIKN